MHGISQVGRLFQEEPDKSSMGGLSRIQISEQSSFQNKKNGREPLSKIRVTQPKLSSSESNSQGTSPYSQTSKTLRSMNSSGMNYSNDQFKQAEIKYPSGNRKIQSEIQPNRNAEFKSTSNMKMHGMQNKLEQIDEESFTLLRQIKEHEAKRRLTEGNILLWAVLSNQSLSRIWSKRSRTWLFGIRFWRTRSGDCRRNSMGRARMARCLRGKEGKLLVR